MAKKSSKKKAPGRKPPAPNPAAGKAPANKRPPKPVKPATKVGARRPKKSDAGGVVSAQTLRTLDVATYVGLHLLVITVPLAFGQFTFDQFDMPKVVTLRFITLFIAATWGARFLLSGKTQIRRTPMDWFILAFLAWVTVSTVFSVHLPTAMLGKYRRYEGFISLVNYGVVFFITVQTLRSYGRLRALAKSMLITGAVVGVYGLGQYFGYDILQWGQLPFDKFRAFATYGNPDLLVGYLALLVPIGIGLFITTEDKYESAAYGLCTVITLAALIVTFSRSAWPGLVVAFIYLGVVLWRQRMLTDPRVLAIALAVVLVVGGLTVYSLRSQYSVTSVYERFQSLFRPTEGSAGTRYEIWKSSIAATKARPFFGFGPDTYRLIFPMYKTVRYVQMAGYRSVADNAHSYPMQLAPAIGIPGMILFYVLVFFGFGRAAGLTLKRGGHESERIMIASFAAGALAYGIHLLFGLSVTGTTIFLWICFACYMLPFAKTVEIDWRPSSAAVRSAVLSACFIALVSGVYLNWRFFSADTWNLRSYQYQEANKDAALQAIDEALRLNPYWDAYRAQKVMLLLDKANSAGEGESLLGAVKFVRQSIMESPREYDNYLFLANAYSGAWRMLRDQKYLASSPESPYATKKYDVDEPDGNVPESALDVSLYALRNVEPNAPSAMVQAGLAYMDVGRMKEALAEFERAVFQDPNYSEAFYYLGNAQERAGDKRKALASYDEALRLRKAAAASGQPVDFPEASAAAQRLRKGSK